MRIAIVSAAAVKKDTPDYITSLAKGMESMGHRVDIVDVWKEDGMRLPGYEYIAVAAEPISPFSGKLPPLVSKALSAGSSLVGKKSAAFIKKTGLFSNKALANLMKAMEKEGMRINWSDILFNAPHAEAMGKKIGA
jgi:menaquinone-dependent protoporphyrinogen IX oxidase